MNNINITLTPYQHFVLPRGFANDTVTITGPASAVVVNNGTYKMQGADSLSILGPKLAGLGTIKVSPLPSGHPQLELSAVGENETINFIGVDAGTLQLDQPLAFLGTIHGQQESFNDWNPSFLSPNGNVLNAFIALPSVTGFDQRDNATGGRAVFQNHVLSIFDASGQLEAKLHITGVKNIVLVGSGYFSPGVGVDISPTPTPDHFAFSLTNNGPAVSA